MKRFINTIKNIFSIEELRDRIITTVWLLLIFRLGSFIVLPGVDTKLLPGLDQASAPGILGVLNTFLGGAFSRASIFALGIMPYISASIVIQLLTIAVPYFQRMQKEGESGRKKLNQITRVLTIAITLVQASAYIGASGTIPSEAILVDRFFFTVSSMIILTAGTIFCMWLGEKITDKGIGNGISMLIMIGIVSRFPGALVAESVSRGSSLLLLFLLELIALFFVVMGVILLTQAVRKIPVQYAKQVAGAKESNKKPVIGQRSYLPLKINSAGVMPIIFAQSLMFLPSLVASLFADTNDFANYIYTTFQDFTTWQYNLTFAILIILFTFFYTAITVNPKQIAEDMKRNGGFVPGVKPGDPTAEYIDNIVDRITLPAALFISIVAIMPAFASMAGVSQDFAQFYGGTSLLIMVGVILDTLQQIESYLLMKHYEGLMETGNVKGRKDVAVA
jgi:preprotein translocase subunit SecY